MIVIGADTHKASHTLAAVFASTGELAGELTAPAREPGFLKLLNWGRSLGEERTWALEDCRHISGGFERYLVAAGERVVRVTPHLSARERGQQRVRGKSDPIDARAIARAALREGIESLPAAYLDQASQEIKLLLDHREDLVAARTGDQQRLRWHLHELWPDFELRSGCLDRVVWLDRVARKLARAEQSTKVRIARELLVEIRRRTRRVLGLEREIGQLVKAKAPQLLDLKGCGALTAAKLIAETSGAKRLASDAKFARLAGAAPIPASSGQRNRHRLDRGGNRQLNCALHRIAVTQGNFHEPARAYLAKKQAEGKSRKEALRCLKRHLARRVWKLLLNSEIERSSTTVGSQRISPSAQIAATA